ncbi:MAG: CotH kinase family protein [Lewinellaceae bacterium]|nr:CotH kinase family protein [Lewinellaceae bacterium]
MTYHGIYIMVEQVDKNFLRNYFADDEGTLYKNKICELEIEAGPATFGHMEEIDRGCPANPSALPWKMCWRQTLFCVIFSCIILSTPS